MYIRYIYYHYCNYCIYLALCRLHLQTCGYEHLATYRIQRFLRLRNVTPLHDTVRLPNRWRFFVRQRSWKWGLELWHCSIAATDDFKTRFFFPLKSQLESFAMYVRTWCIFMQLLIPLRVTMTRCEVQSKSLHFPPFAVSHHVFMRLAIMVYMLCKAACMQQYAAMIWCARLRKTYFRRHHQQYLASQAPAEWNWRLMACNLPACLPNISLLLISYAKDCKGKHIGQTHRSLSVSLAVSFAVSLVGEELRSHGGPWGLAEVLPERAMIYLCDPAWLQQWRRDNSVLC